MIIVAKKGINPPIFIEFLKFSALLMWAVGGEGPSYLGLVLNPMNETYCCPLNLPFFMVEQKIRDFERETLIIYVKCVLYF